MTQTEMEETQGAALPLLLVLGGGATAAWKNHYDSYKETGGPASVTDTIRATGEGALIGASLYGGGRAIGGVRNLAFDGSSAGLKYGEGRIFGIRHGVGDAKKTPIFRLDYHTNPSPTKLHLHIGKGDLEKLHRPWYAPWKKF